MQPYQNASKIAGDLQTGSQVHYRKVFSWRERFVLWLLTIAAMGSQIGFIAWIVWPTRWTELSSVGQIVFWSIAVALMVVIEGMHLGQSSALLFFAHTAKDPIPLAPRPDQRIAVLTTIVPGKEPFDLVQKTLKAMLAMEYDGLVDVWLLDEGDDPEIKAECLRLGVNHFSRKGIQKYNQKSGEYRAKTKHGNHNAWRAENESNYDVVVQMDPDHIPMPDFLERVIGYFNDPDVAFVVAPQVYGNLRKNWIANGSAFQAYVFHGVIQRGGNGMDAPLLIGTNHAYRPTTFAQIGGYQDCIIEDHLTSMVVYGHANPETGNTWKGVYTPDILAIGEGPTTFTDYYSQQKRWAYGIWEIIRGHSPEKFQRLRRPQRLAFILLQLFYPSVALVWLASNLLTTLYLFGGIPGQLPPEQWFAFWLASNATSLGTFFWLRRFNLVKHERCDVGLVGMGLLLMCIPIYLEAALAQLTGKPLAYAVTAKGNLSSPDNMATFRAHTMWLMVFVTMFSVSMTAIASSYPILRFWMIVNMLICAAPLVIHYGGGLRNLLVTWKFQLLERGINSAPRELSLLEIESEETR